MTSLIAAASLTCAMTAASVTRLVRERTRLSPAEWWVGIVIGYAVAFLKWRLF